MKTDIIKINKGLFLNAVIDQIPTNTILFKTAPGIGATHMELNAKRNSIIIEPNLPVIKGKKKQFENIYGVYEGIDIYQIMEYLKKDKIPYKKILTTPESFWRIKEATDKLNINLYKDFFLLYDECERTMKDIKFRKKIVAPMEDFFKFKSKAFVSATPVIPSDPRFLLQGFKKLEIEPTYSYQKEMDLIITNHVVLALKDQLENLKSENIFIFFNSTKGILRLIEKLGIKEESNIYCSKTSVNELSGLKFKRANENLTDKFAKYNFFTSRFNSAVDIFLDTIPDVVIITDLWTSQHSMVDPHSDAVQISGRFRNFQGKLNSLTVITNINRNINALEKEEATGYLKGCKEGYNAIKALRDGATKDGAIDILNEALSLVSYSSYINEDGSANYFMIDNYLYEEKVKCLYKNEEHLIKAYSESMHFKPTVRYMKYKVSDEQPPKDQGEKANYKELLSFTIKKLEQIHAPSEMLYVIDNSDILMEELNSTLPEIVQAYKTLTKEQILKCPSKNHLIYETKKQQIENDKSNFSFIQMLNLEFTEGSTHTGNQILTILKKLIAKYSLSLKPEIKLLNDYFKVTRTNFKKGKGYKIVSSKFNSGII